MNATVRRGDYVRGEVVGHVDLDALLGPREVPASPERWYILRVYPHLQVKVMKTFRQRNISSWVPMETITHSVSRYNRGFEKIVEQRVVVPMITGVVLLPDFEAKGRRYMVDGVIDILRVGPCVPALSRQDMIDLRNIQDIRNTPKSKREHKFEIGELVRVTSGPFAHCCGRVERFDSTGRLMVGVDIFGRVTLISIEESDLDLEPRPRSTHRSNASRNGFRRNLSR
jgi:transcriptional antiterminator NusG